MMPLQKLDVAGHDSARGLARSVMEDNLNQLEQEATITVQPDAPAIDVMRKMKTVNSGCALVLNGDKLIGIFTEHDVLHRMFGQDSSPRDIAVSELMTHNPESLRETDSVAAALSKMSLGRYRHIPVARKDGSYSVTSIKSVLKYIAKEDW